MKANLSVVSLHSSSKGFVGECGLRGGCMLLSNVGEDVRRQIYKLASMSLCSNTLGQAAIALVCSPPTPENPSYNQFSKQKTHLLKVSRAKAQLAYARLNAIPGVSCRPIGGAVFCFPKITLPPRKLALVPLPAVFLSKCATLALRECRRSFGCLCRC